jgi:hypothetical protein
MHAKLKKKHVLKGRGLPVPVLCDDRCDQAVWKHRTALNHAPSALVFACKKTKQDTTQPRPRPYPSNVYALVYG